MMGGLDGPKEARRMTPLKLLVVEDNLASLELMTEVFTSLKAEVRPISDSEKAVAVVLGGHFKSGHVGSLQNRPYELIWDSIYFYLAA
jgi:CheY-like chemotaxis protein